MSLSIKDFFGNLIKASGLGWFPVRARKGFNAGCWWSMHPWSAYWRGTYEPGVQQLMDEIGIAPGWTCWDLGSHYGYYSFGFARRVGVSGQVCAFEPNPLSYRRLRYHKFLNRQKNLLLFPNAVSDRAATLSFYTYGQMESTSTHLPYESETCQEGCKPINVEAVCLDDLVSQGRIRLPNLMKVDVEGHAHHAFAGMRRVLAQARPILFIGFHGAPEASGVRRILADLDYEERVISASQTDSDGKVTVGDLLFLPRKR